jgi:hypothetical protein
VYGSFEKIICCIKYMAAFKINMMEQVVEITWKLHVAKVNRFLLFIK